MFGCFKALFGKKTNATAKFSLEDCDEWCEATSVTSKTAVKTYGFVVHDFQKMIKEGKSVISSQFCIENTKWKIKVDCGYVNLEGKGYVRIGLGNENSQDYAVDGALTAYGKTIMFYSSKDVVPAGCWRVWVIMNHAECLKKMVNGKFFVKAEISVVKKGEIKIISGRGVTSKESGRNQLIDKIFTSKAYTDIMIVSNGVKFPCHKVFVGQSETLQKLVDRRAPEGNIIMDEFSSDVVENFINFLYQKPMKGDVFQKNLVDFLGIGEVYDLPELKWKAEISMISGLDKDTFAEFFLAADLLRAEKLKEAGLKFIAQNKNLWAENIEGGHWKEKFGKKPVLLMEIIKAVTTTG